MAEKQKEVSTAAVKKVDTKLGFGGKTQKWFREMRSELKKVVWPTPKQLVNNTAVSLVVMAGSAIVLWAFDFVADQGVQLLLKIGG